MIRLGSHHRCVMATFVFNAQKKRIGTAMPTTSRESQQCISVHGLEKKVCDREAFTLEKRCQELEEKSKQEAAAAKSHLKQNEDVSTAETTEAEA